MMHMVSHGTAMGAGNGQLPPTTCQLGDISTLPYLSAHAYTFPGDPSVAAKWLTRRTASSYSTVQLGCGPLQLLERVQMTSADAAGEHLPLKPAMFRAFIYMG